ncbi:MAG: Panacea domain-containing protein [Patescibacteria group bacterium]|mgnify:CR=1 FL=1
MKKNLQLLAYLAKGHPEASITVLIKLCYLADLISLKRFKKKISTFEYIRYYFGPFDPEVYGDLESLVKDGVLIATPEYTQKGAEAIIYHFNETKDLNIKDISKEDKVILDELLESVRGYGAKTLTEITYNTKPMKALGATLGGNENLGKELNLTTA